MTNTYEVKEENVTVDQLIEKLTAAKAAGIITGDAPIWIDGSYGFASTAEANAATPTEPNGSVYLV